MSPFDDNRRCIAFKIRYAIKDSSEKGQIGFLISTILGIFISMRRTPQSGDISIGLG